MSFKQVFDGAFAVLGCSQPALFHLVSGRESESAFTSLCDQAIAAWPGKGAASARPANVDSGTCLAKSEKEDCVRAYSRTADRTKRSGALLNTLPVNNTRANTGQAHGGQVIFLQQSAIGKFYPIIGLQIPVVVAVASASTGWQSDDNFGAITQTGHW